MNKKIFIDLLKSIVFFGGIFVLFYFGIQLLSEERKTSWFYSDIESQLISYEQEIQLGDLIAEHLIENNKQKVIQNKFIDSVVWAVSSHLQKQIELSEYDYEILVLDSPQTNAFTIPGGRIYVFKGLLEFCDSAEQLAAVLAHEMGHIEKRHTVSKLVKEFGIKIIFSLLGGDTLLLGELWETVLSSNFDRSQEKEADQFALKLLEEAQISPTAIASFFRKLNRENLDYNEKMELLMTHPHNNSRIKSSLEYKTQEGFKPQLINIDWNLVKKALSLNFLFTFVEVNIHLRKRNVQVFAAEDIVDPFVHVEKNIPIILRFYPSPCGKIN
tara:strand:- start:3372 stop:4355 length:984 start_codon:yes stop_codon:yes gene_type:complete